MNYVSSHDDGYPFDIKRERAIESGTKLLLAPGISQIYYGDESARTLQVQGTIGDASLRSKMNWNAISSNQKTKKILEHYQKLGQFRNNHPAVGAGIHKQIESKTYTFSRIYTKDTFTDKIVVALKTKKGKKEITVESIFEDGELVHDAYSGEISEVNNGKVIFDTTFNIVLIEKSYDQNLKNEKNNCNTCSNFVVY